MLVLLWDQNGFSVFLSFFKKKIQYYLTDINNVSLMMSLPFVEVARHV